MATQLSSECHSRTTAGIIAVKVPNLDELWTRFISEIERIADLSKD